jgi:hypothetical protein
MSDFFPTNNDGLLDMPFEEIMNREWAAEYVDLGCDDPMECDGPHGVDNPRHPHAWWVRLEGVSTQTKWSGLAGKNVPVYLFESTYDGLFNPSIAQHTEDFIKHLVETHNEWLHRMQKWDK